MCTYSTHEEAFTYEHYLVSNTNSSVYKVKKNNHEWLATCRV